MQRDEFENPENPEEKNEIKRPKGRPPLKKALIPDSVKGTVQIVPAEFVKNADKGKPTFMSVSELKEKKNIPKKQMSDSQKAHLQKLIEMNKARRRITKDVEIPEEIPEGYEAVFIPPSRSKYGGQPPSKPAPTPINMVPTGTQSVQNPDMIELIRQMNERMNQLNEKMSKRERKPRKPVSYKRKDETSETDARTESECESSDTEYVKKYEKKAARRMEAVKQIEEKLAKPAPPPKPKTKYDNLSIF